MGGPLAARILVTGFRPGPAGVGRVMMNLINGFARSGVETHVLVDTGSYPELESAQGGVCVHRLEPGGTDGAAARLRGFLTELRPRAVLSNRDDANALLVAATAQMTDRPGVVLRVGSNLPEKLRRSSPFTRWRRRRELVSVLRGADLLIGNSKGVCDGLRELLGSQAPPIEAIYNPLDIERARRLAAEPSEHLWFRAGGRPLLVSVGRLSRIKDQATLLRAFALLPQDFRLVIFGEGPQRERLQALAGKLGVADRFDLPGHTLNPFSHLARADLFILSSLFEGSPNALIEALAVGTPAVSTDCPSGPREILEDGRYGALVPGGDHRAMAAAIAEVMARPPGEARLREAVLRFDMMGSVRHYLRAMDLSGHASADGSDAERAPAPEPEPEPKPKPERESKTGEARLVP